MPLHTGGSLLDDERARLLDEVLGQTRLGTPSYTGPEATRLPVGDPRMLMTPEQFAMSPGARGMFDQGGGVVNRLLAQSEGQPGGSSAVAPTVGRTGGALSPMSAAGVQPARMPMEPSPPGVSPWVGPSYPGEIPPTFARTIIQRLLDRTRGRGIAPAGTQPSPPAATQMAPEPPDPVVGLGAGLPGGGLTGA